MLRLVVLVNVPQLLVIIVCCCWPVHHLPTCTCHPVSDLCVGELILEVSARICRLPYGNIPSHIPISTARTCRSIILVISISGLDVPIKLVDSLKVIAGVTSTFWTRIPLTYTIDGLDVLVDISPYSCFVGHSPCSCFVMFVKSIVYKPVHFSILIQTSRLPPITS